MNKFVSTQSVAMMLGLSFIAVSACDQRNPISPSAGPGIGSPFVKPDGNGNGAPSGAHFNLNLLGMTRDKTASIAGGNRIFIYFEGRTKIMLREGDYAVIDGNGTDGTAEFQLPNPDPEGDGGQLAYSVWVRPVAGKGSASFQSCFTEFETNSTWCYAGSLVQNLTKNNKFTDVSRDLLQVCADVDTTDGTDLQLVPLFSDLGEDYFWYVDNDGMRNVQMRFYPISTTAIGGACDRIPG
jgi:hypothetical protein